MSSMVMIRVEIPRICLSEVNVCRLLGAEHAESAELVITT
jgi:hypothetical protein